MDSDPEAYERPRRVVEQAPVLPKKVLKNVMAFDNVGRSSRTVVLRYESKIYYFRTDHQ